MNKFKLYLSAGLFLFLTAIKLISPHTALEIKEKTLRIIDYNDNYTEVAKYIENLRYAEETPLPAGENEPKIELLPVSGEEEGTYRIKTLQMQTKGKLPEVFVHLPEKEQEEPPEPAEETVLPEAVTVFLEAQETFSEYEIPENATYAYLELGIEYASPVSGVTSSGFGYRVHPIYGDVRFHYGTDFAANSGTDVLAFSSGTVLTAGYDSSYGHNVKIDHGEGLVTLYAHCSELLVSAGDEVSAGQKIAHVGASGLATGPHLHFELMKDGEYINPEYYLGSL